MRGFERILKAVAEAAKPLYDSLTDAQKRDFGSLMRDFRRRGKHQLVINYGRDPGATSQFKRRAGLARDRAASLCIAPKRPTIARELLEVRNSALCVAQSINLERNPGFRIEQRVSQVGPGHGVNANGQLRAFSWVGLVDFAELFLKRRLSL
jgi:hypothetical protein